MKSLAKEQTEPSNIDLTAQETQKHVGENTEKVASIEAAWPKLLCFCRECGNDHLPRDCPSRPLPRDKTTLNVVETIPISSENDIASLNVLTRAQEKQQRVGDSSQMETKKKPKK